MSSTQIAREVLHFLKQKNCKDIVICPGGRNAPFVELLTEGHGFDNVYSQFDERAASFFALGLAKKREANSPVCIITTSGTAVAEVYPAILEAYYGGWPFILLSCDRPSHYRGSGAPQTIDQVRLFDSEVCETVDVEKNTDLLHEFLNRRIEKPLQINVCLEEPLICQNQESPSLLSETNIEISFTQGNSTNPPVVESPIIVVGGLLSDERQTVKNFILKQELPVYLEASSGLSGDVELQDFQIVNYSPLLNLWLEKGHAKSVLRLGDVPVCRFWRDLEACEHTEVLSFSNKKWTGLPRQVVENFPTESLKFLEIIRTSQYEEGIGRVKKLSNDIEAVLCRLVSEFPNSELAFLRKISNLLPNNSNLFLGNSSPIRDWNLMDESKSNYQVHSNRGVNGIDGLLSTFFGTMESHTYNYCVLGDLSALYDLNSAWTANQYFNDYNFSIFVINNKGGKIFKRLFDNAFFENSHRTTFKNWAAQFDLSYTKVENIGGIDANSKFSKVVEVFPNEKQTEQFLNRLKKWFMDYEAF